MKRRTVFIGRQGFNETHKGHAAYHNHETRKWYYSDTGEDVNTVNRPCAHCQAASTEEGHDACLGTLPGVSNACCGHGDLEQLYVLLEDGRRLEYNEALAYIATHKE